MDQIRKYVPIQGIYTQGDIIKKS